MRILHYALGFYPYRTGGMTAYVMDVMAEQKRQGHQVGMLWPGRMNYFGKRCPAIKKSCNKDYLTDSYELINPLPVPLLEGINDISSYIKKCDKRIFLNFFSEIMPDVIHIHTFMGLYAEFLEAAKELKIPVLYTTHDYFPLCPKVNLIFQGENCQRGMEDEACSLCNQGALPVWKISLMQSPVYRKLKNSFLFQKMRKEYHIEKQKKQPERCSLSVRFPFHLLKDYYKRMLQLLDCVLCNSTNAEEIYKKFGEIRKTKLLTISNSKVQDHRRIRKYSENQKLRLTYLGTATEAKGYFLLRDALDELVSQGERGFCLNVFTAVAEKRDYLKVREPYEDEKGMEEVYDHTDVLIVPSLWKETFGFVVLEALSYGTPVIVTENVGAKNLIVPGRNGYCVKAEKAEIIQTVKALLHDRKILTEMNKNICRGTFEYSMEEHVRRLQEIYENINYYSNI